MSYLKSLKPVLTSFKLRSFFFSIAFFNIGFHFLSLISHSFDTLHPFALLNLKSTMTPTDAKGYFSLFFALSPISFLLCLVAFTPPEFSFRLLCSASASDLIPIFVPFYNKRLADSSFFCNLFPLLFSL